MEVTALLFRLLMFEFFLLGTQVQDSYTHSSDAGFLRVSPNRLQHFQTDSVSFDCGGFDAPTQLRRSSSFTEFNLECDIKSMPTGSVCTIDRIYPVDIGEYWCETAGGKRSNSVNITVTVSSVILVIPADPVMMGTNVTLRCSHKTNPTNPTADFYKDGRRMTWSAKEMTIYSVSTSDEGLYKCSIPDVGASPASWLAVRAASVILDSPVLPVMEGNTVTLSCKNKTTSSNLTADFYKDGRLMKSSSTGQMIIHRVSKSDEGLYKCLMSDGEESPQSWLAVRAASVILDSPVLPVMEGNNVTLSCRTKTTSSNLTADFYKDGRLMKSSSTGQMIIHRVSKSDEGLYKCLMSDGGESPQSWLAVRAIHRETSPSSDQFLYVLLLLRTVFTVVMVALLLLLVGLLHCGKLPRTHK